MICCCFFFFFVLLQQNNVDNRRKKSIWYGIRKKPYELVIAKIQNGNFFEEKEIP